MFDFRSYGHVDFFDKTVEWGTSEPEIHNEEWPFFYNEENDRPTDED